MAVTVAAASMSAPVGTDASADETFSPTRSGAVIRRTSHGDPATTTWLPPQDSEQVAPPAYEAPVCDLECTEQILCGYDGCSPPTTSDFEVHSPPCRPSTVSGCDPDEPMELPVIGCEYLERDITGKVRCVD